MAGESDKTSAAPFLKGRVRWLRPIARFAAWWFSLFTLLGPLSVCPVCGQSGCPGGAASAGILGGVMAAFISGLRWVRDLARRHRQGKEGCAGMETGVGGMPEHVGNRMATDSIQTDPGREGIDGV